MPAAEFAQILELREQVHMQQPTLPGPGTGPILTKMKTTGTINWGVLSTANIGTEKVIPAMQKGSLSRVVGIASRNEESAARAAKQLGIPKSYGSYEALLADPEIEAVYIPLPNHLHVEWCTKALEAGKHVLCEKPLALTAAEIEALDKVAKKAGRKIGEAFMVHTNPQWVFARDAVRQGKLGQVSSFQASFTYFNDDAANIRNIKEYGGGALWDIGCYPVHTSRFVFGEEPSRVLAAIDFDPRFSTDRHVWGILEFPSGRADFYCSTQAASAQKVQIFGSEKRLEIAIPFNAPNQEPCVVTLSTDSKFPEAEERVSFPACDQYTIQGDEFSRAILEGTEVPVPLSDALGNVRVLNALFESAARGGWVTL